MTSEKMTQSFELSDADIKQAVREYIENRFGVGGELKVDCRVATVTTGYGMQESDSHVVKITATRTP